MSRTLRPSLCAIALITTTACGGEDPVRAPERADTGGAHLRHDPWSAHPMVRLRHSLPEGVHFDEVIQEEGEDWQSGPWQRLHVLPSAPTPPQSPGFSASPANVAAAVDEAYAAAPDAERRLLITLRTERPWDEASVTHRVERGLFSGEITDEASYEEVRASALEERADLARVTIDDWVAARPAWASRLVDRGERTPWIAVLADANDLAELRLDPEIVAIDLDAEGVHADATATGYSTAMRVNPYYVLGFEGYQLTSNVAMIETNPPWDGHPAYRFASSTTSRVITFDCRTSFGACTINAPLSFTDDHATAVVGVLLGDNTRSQHAELLNGFRAQFPFESNAQYAAARAAAQRDRSGVARRAGMYAFGTGSTLVSSRMGKAYDTMRGQAKAVPIVNISTSLDLKHLDGSPNPSCSPTTAASKHVNAFYEDGGLTFKSAGNWGDPRSYLDNDRPVPACTVGDPGAALSAMAVGGVDDAYTNTTSPTIARSTGSSYSDPAGRALVKLVSYYRLEAPFRKVGPYGWDTQSYGPAPDDQEELEPNLPPDDYRAREAWRGTSFSAPAVAAAAAVFRGWYVDTLSSFIDEPGMLAASLLHMGDRHQTGGAYLNQGFDPNLGAGLLELELYDSAHQPAHWGRAYSKQCVGSFASVFHDVNNGNPIEGDITDLEATLWWYDVDHDTGGALSNLNLYLWRKNSAGVWQIMRSSTSTQNNMERVHWQPHPLDWDRVYRWEIRPSGTVAADHICTTGTRAYLAQSRKGL